VSDQKIDGFYSEYSIKDNASETIAKITKKDKELQKSVQTGTKGVKERENAIKSRAREEQKAQKAAEKAAKDETRLKDRQKKDEDKRYKDQVKRQSDQKKAVGDRVSGASAAAGGALGGDVIGTAGGALPLGLGAAIVGMVAAINRASSALQSSVGVTKERARSARAGSVIGDVGGRGLGAGFSKQELQDVITMLGEEGIEKVSDQMIKVINTEGRKLGSLTAGARSLLEGEGLEGYGQAGRNVKTIGGNIPRNEQTAQFRAETLAGLIADLEGQNTKIVDMQANLSKGYASFQARQDAIERNRQDLDIGLASKKGLDNAVMTLDKVNAEAAGLGVSAGTSVIEEAQDFIKDMSEDPMATIGTLFNPFGKQMRKQAKKMRKNASGGFSPAGESTIVGENGVPEIFTPQVNGIVTPLNRLRGGGGGVSIGNVQFNINGALDPERIMQVIKQNFVGMINEYANREFAQELGLNGGIG
jgi:hypothetical protein